MEKKKEGSIGAVIIILAIMLAPFFIVLDMLDLFDGEDLSFVPFVVFGFAVFVVIIAALAKKRKEFLSNQKLDQTADNHNKTFHKSEWAKLGIDKNDFAIDKNQYLKEIHNDKNAKVKSSFLDFPRLYAE